MTDLQDQMKTAMKAHDQARLDALRLMVSAIKYVIVDKPDLDDAGMTEVLIKEAKKRREAIVAYKAAGRTEQAEQEEYELRLIEDYLPKMMGEEEVRVKVKEALEATKPENFGMAMNAAMKAVGGQSNGATVSKIVKELFIPQG
ncbi:MAG: GatB/YqeY domain-containing protein [Microgenomates group bacterium]